MQDKLNLLHETSLLEYLVLHPLRMQQIVKSTQRNQSSRGYDNF